MFARAFFAMALGLSFTAFAALAANEDYKALKTKIEDKYLEATCTETNSLKSNNRLLCISCAIEKVTKIKPSEKYLSLLAYNTAKYDNLGTTVNERINRTTHARPSQGISGEELYHAGIMQRVQAFGFCSDKKSYGQIQLKDREMVFAAVTNYYSKFIEVVEGKKVVGSASSTGYDTPQEKELVKYFGFSSIQAAKDLLNDDGWSGSSTADRSRAFEARVSPNTYNSSENGESLKACIGDATIMKRTFSEEQKLEMCQLAAFECDFDVSKCGGNVSVVTPPRPIPPAMPASARPGVK